MEGMNDLVEVELNGLKKLPVLPSSGDKARAFRARAEKYKPRLPVVNRLIAAWEL
jgi:hypothetical protein